MTLDLRLDHFTVLTDDLDTTIDFYRDILGLTPGPRPDFDMDGAWLYAGTDGDKTPVLHVILTDNPPSEPRGILDHMAFRATTLNPIKARLDTRGIPYDLRQTPKPWEQWQLFFDGPNGERVEVDC